jgi:phytoene dehydrogenase-like protein
VAARYDAVVVGSGPNGLAAAIVLARAGRKVLVREAQEQPGGGARSLELTLPGFIHDLCSAIHPMGISSPYFKELELEKYGLFWEQPEIPFAHPLDGGEAAFAYRSLDETCRGLGADGEAWRRHFAHLVEGWDTLSAMLLAHPVRVPADPLLMTRFGLHAMRSAAAFCVEEFDGQKARALLGGCAAHSFAPLTRAFTAGMGFALATPAFALGWPAARGGSQEITQALINCFKAAGGELECGAPVASLDALPEARAVLFDTTPINMASIVGDALPGWYQALLRNYKRGPGVFKLDYALDGPVPWTNAECGKAGTLHLGGTLDEIAAAEAQVNDGQVPERPFVLCAQQSVFDVTRAPVGKHTFYAYCHVPNGCTVDMTERVEAQLERFAPGFKDRVMARAVKSPLQLEATNQNYLGGDIANGEPFGLQLFARPVPSLTPWATPNPKFFLCSAATPPGPGVHGMCGVFAAKAALSSALK